MKKHQLPLPLIKMIRNPKSGLYEVVEQGVTYTMDIEMTRLLKQYFRNNERGKIADWYKQLPREEKQAVGRSGHLEIKSEDFYPDPDYE